MEAACSAPVNSWDFPSVRCPPPESAVNPASPPRTGSFCRAARNREVGPAAAPSPPARQHGSPGLTRSHPVSHSPCICLLLSLLGFGPSSPRLWFSSQRLRLLASPLFPGLHFARCPQAKSPGAWLASLAIASRVRPPPPPLKQTGRRDADSSSLTYPREQGKRAGEPEQPARARG